MIIELGVAHDKHFGTTIVGFVKDSDGIVHIVHHSVHLEGDSSARINLDGLVEEYPDDLADAMCMLAKERGQGIDVHAVRDFLKMHAWEGRL